MNAISTRKLFAALTFVVTIMTSLAVIHMRAIAGTTPMGPCYEDASAFCEECPDPFTELDMGCQPIGTIPPNYSYGKLCQNSSGSCSTAQVSCGNTYNCVSGEIYHSCSAPGIACKG